MATTTYTTLKGKRVRIEDNHFGKGGEGKIHKVLPTKDFPNHCAKVFFVKKVTSKSQSEHENRDFRIKYMILNPPVQLEDDKVRVCWPVDALYNGKHIIGFIMPLAFNDSIQLYGLCQPKLKKKLSNDWHATYNRLTKNGVLSRLKLCTNISIAINNVHNDSGYVFVDLKPPNILVTRDGKVSLIDCDSLQISENGKVFFHASVATEEYIPPEGRNVDTKTATIEQSWDLFSLAVIFYQILFGLHPYSVSFKGMNETNNSLQYRIRNSLFAHGQRKSEITVAPELHNHYNLLPYDLRDLFKKAFEITIYGQNGRPTAEEWGRAFYGAIQNDIWIGRGFSQFQTKPPLKPFDIKRGTGTTNQPAQNPVVAKQETHWWKVILSYVFWFVLFIVLMIQCGS